MTISVEQVLKKGAIGYKYAMLKENSLACAASEERLYIYLSYFCHFEMSVAMYRLLQKVKCILEQLCMEAQIRPC